MRKSEGVAFTVWLGALIKNEMSLSELRKLYDEDRDASVIGGD